MKRLLVILALASTIACASAPPSLSPAGVVVWQANEVVLVLVNTQAVAIGLNKIQVCEPAPCRPLLSDGNTRSVVDVVEVTLRSLSVAPAGWKATGLSAADQIDTRLDEAGKSKMKAYTAVIRAVIGGL